VLGYRRSVVTYPPLRLGAAAVMAWACAAQGAAQSFSVTSSLVVSSSRVAPGGEFTATLTLTNPRSAAPAPILAGILSTSAAEIVQISASEGLQVLGPGSCDLGYDCLAPFTGFRTTLASGGVAVLGLTLRVARPPGALFTIEGALAPDPVPAYGLRITSVQVTVAGSGVPSIGPSTLVEGVSAPVNIDPFSANTVVFDPINRLHVAAGADRLANVVATTTEAGTPLGNPFPVIFAPGVEPQPFYGNIDVAYSPDLATTAPNGGVMVAWAEGGQIRAQTLSGLMIGAPRNSVGGSHSVESPRIVYSTTSREFLIVWVEFGVSRWRLWARRIGLNGEPLGPLVDLTDSSEPGRQQFDLTWNPITNEYGVFYIHSASLGTVEFARISADGIILTKTQVARAVRADNLGAAVNSRTGDYILLWSDLDGTFAAQMNARGHAASMGRIDSNGLSSDDSLYISLAFNSASGTFLTTGTEFFWTGVTTVRILHLRELNQYGAPLGAPTLTTQLAGAVISSPPAFADWRLFGHSNPAASVFNLATETIRTISTAGGSQVRLGGCVGPDPFAAFGGGVCFDGGWLPPGVPLPGTTMTYMGGCSTPDPFVALGGGRCVNGGWFPPSAPPPAPSPTPTPSPSPGGCATPDPFVALGGGTCVNGGWYPPGMGAPAPTPTPAPAPGGCITPDPFVALGGGRCINTGWYPPGMGGH
jgi:hypothetical protein